MTECRRSDQTGRKAYVVLQNAALVHRVIDEIWNAGNVELADELFAPSYINHGGIIPDLVRGPEGIKFSVALYRAAFPGLHVAVDDLRVDNDRVTLRWTAGSQVSDDETGNPPTPTRGTLTGLTDSHLVEGRFVESWTSWDAGAVLQRLGIGPPGHEETS
jgi:SnoaL-like polyketide cyclase